MADKFEFQPVRGQKSRINDMPISNGKIYFAYDTGDIYLDTAARRYHMGNSSTGIIYANGNDENITQVPEEDDVTGRQYIIQTSALENPTILPTVDSLILNRDGRFFRVLEVYEATNSMLTTLLAVSGSGSGGEGGGVVVQDLKLEWDESTISQGHVFIYGSQTYAKFIPTAQSGDNKVDLTFEVIDMTGTNADMIFTEPNLNNGAEYLFDTSKLPLSSNLTLRVTIHAANSQMKNQSRTYSITYLKTVAMDIKKVNEKYLPLIDAQDQSGSLELQYIPVGDSSIEETLHIYVDDEQIGTTKIQAGWYNRNVPVNIPRQSHGTHEIKLKISAVVNGTELYTNPIIFEAAWADGVNENPVIWIGKYDDLVINYENSYINYMVYDPVAIQQGLSASVQLQKNDITVNELTVDYSTTNWVEWDVSSLYDVGKNVFSIVCRGVKRDIVINVTEEGSRDLGLAKKDSLLENFSAAGRSSLEIKSTRGVWNDLTGNYAARLENFNWQNNGWKKDASVTGQVDSGTYLSVANGASLTFPTPSLRLNFDKDYSIEARFRVRNVQKYSTLVTTLPKYFYVVIDEQGNRIKSSSSETMAWINTNNKELWYDEYGSPLMDEENVEKTYETKNGVICKWMNNDEYGLVLGSQEAYFKSPRGIISVRYKEDEVVNISCVISKTDGLVYIYLNGILSGADSLPPAGQTGQFTINSPFVFNSDYCDVDIYRFRIFQTGLSMPDVIHNYLSDMHSITLYDQNQLTDALDPTQLSYELLLDYNEQHPDALTMPYAVWRIKDGERNEKLPYFKGDSCKADITFVNPSADKALADEVITPWIYYGSSPSTFATDVDIDVQGTSSQGYPRRNYKTKYKKATSWIYTNGPLAGYSVSSDYYFYKNNGQLVTVEDEEGNLVPLQDSTQVDSSTMYKLTSKFHMDNQNIGVNKFTWKIDYMESSGTYNTGFANLLGNLQYPLYTKHPIQDLGLNGSGLRTTVYGYPVLTFHEYADYSNNVSNPGVQYEYIGRYNLNLDKSANEAYGFELKDKNPYNNLSIKSIAECWELEDNQGTWCSFKFPDDASRELGFGTAQDGYPNRMEAFRHFEYRYSPYEDQLDAIGADGKYDGTTTDTAIIAEIGTNEAQKTAYARDKYLNLEKLFFWLDSTDATNCPSGEDRSIYIRKPVKNQDGSVSISKEKLDSISYNTATDYSGKDGATSEVLSSGGYRVTFTLDTPEYRLEKFRNELEKHLDLEYCLVYFVLTELLLCYDSRGKNMMLASFGPHEIDGEYIWYPMFYDIDTQLGLNNSGSYLWDYDADVTLDGLFSTPSSVLWTNLYTMFQNEIKNKYRAFRGADDGSSVKNNLTYEKITGAYECNPSVFNSYAMRGIRPVIAIGLDEYYKYFATTKTGYFDTKGTLIIEDTPNFAYCCQGDKKLTTELLLRNRLNYIDSWWLGGDYEITKVKQGQFWGRVNGNRLSQTSDKFLDLTPEEIASDSKYAGFKSSNGMFPIPYLDAQPNYTLKPFLKQYVTYYTDEVPEIPVKYNATQTEENGVTVQGSENTLKPYRETPETPQDQLTYLPGVDYLSSMGDLSTLYFNEFHLTAGKRLLDLIVGSDVPGYENGLLDTNRGFDLSNGKGSSTPKSLLKKVVLTQMTSFDKTVPMEGSEKLEEFRALGTKLVSVYFAKGAPLHTVHLPSTITGLELSENQELTNIITSKPIVARWVNKTTKEEVAFNDITNFSEVEVEYAEPASYRGLYLEKITDYTSANANTGHNLAILVIEGGGLGYDSYRILDNLIKLKDQATANNTLSISLKDVTWTPYTLVEYGEAYDNSKRDIYYKVNDHSMFDAYTYVDEEVWNRDTLNGLIYTYNSTVPKGIITNTSLLDKLIEQYEIAKANNDASQFSNTAGLSTATIPTITGRMFIANRNGSPIEEEDLTGKYASREYFPNLQIYAENVREANVTKYVRILDNGAEELVEQPLRSSNVHPLAPTAQVPAKANYDFIGWSLDPEGEQMALQYVVDEDTGIGAYEDLQESLENISFDSNTTVITFYAQFEIHKFRMFFYDGDGSLLRKVYVDSGLSIYNNLPPILPYKEPDSNVGFYEVYKHTGWSAEQGGTAIAWTDENLGKASKDREFYPIFGKDSVYNNILGEEFLYCDENGTMSFAVANQLKGKITLPKTWKGITVTKFSGFFQGTSLIGPNPELTHIFWEKGSSVQEYAYQAFCNTSANGYFRTKLVYIEIPNNNFIIGQSAFCFNGYLFTALPYTTHEENELFLKDEIFDKISVINPFGFADISGSWHTEGEFLRNYKLYLPGVSKLTQISRLAFARSDIGELQLGAPSDAFITPAELGDNIFEGYEGSTITIYYDSSINPEDYKAKIGLSYDYNMVEA